MPLCQDYHFSVVQSECDPWRRMSCGAILRRVQQASVAHCEELGLDDPFYARTQTAYLLSRISLQVYTAPLVRQKLRMQTRAYAMHRATWQRVTSFYDEAGTLLCESDATWVLVNTETRHILRQLPAAYEGIFSDPPGAEGHESKMPKIKETRLLATLPATYSMCDSNGHINNTHYADIVCDALPIEKLEKFPVCRMLLYYRSEIPLGEHFELCTATFPEGYYVSCEQQGRRNFEAWVEF